MKALEISLIIWLSLCAFILLIMHIKSHKFLKSVALNAALSYVAILIINLTKGFSGVFIPLNFWSVGGCGVFGLPCVCGILILQTII